MVKYIHDFYLSVLLFKRSGLSLHCLSSPEVTEAYFSLILMVRATLLRTRMDRTSRCGNTHRKPSSSSYRETSQSSISVRSNIIGGWEWFTMTAQKTLFCRKTLLVHFKGIEPTIYLEWIIMPLVDYKLGQDKRSEWLICGKLETIEL